MKFILLKLIRIYQALVSGGVATPFLFGGYSGCRSWPTCSEYSYAAVAEDGILRGGARAVRRVLNCHPFSSKQYTRV